MTHDDLLSRRCDVHSQRGNDSVIRLGVAVLLSVISSAIRADDTGVDFFEKKIRPVLVQQCYECHSTDSKKVGGGLLLDSRDAVRRGGESGMAIVPGQPDKSLLIKALRWSDDSVQMPPKGKLSAAVIADFEEWIRRGTPDPRDQSTARVERSWDEQFRERLKWWSLQPVRKPAAPATQKASWSDNRIDQFVLAKWEANGLTPATAAKGSTLVRRLSLVLTGLPPSALSGVPGDEFAKRLDDSSDGIERQRRYEELVDQLLASLHFGERWARHWMDVVRFTETHGNEWNYEVHHAWRYRDYLIRAFNVDVPFNQFLVEHIAGDLLPDAKEVKSDAKFVMRRHPTERFQESPIGTGFFRFGEVNHDDCIGLPALGYDIADNQLDTLTKAFLATTVACARCHDHKLDAVSMQDYYALLGVIRSSRLVAHTVDSPETNAELITRLKQLKLEIRRELAACWQHDADLFGKYMLAAEAKVMKRPDAESLASGLDAARLEKWVATLTADKQPLEDLFEPWRVILRADDELAEWRRLAERYAQEDRVRADFNREHFESWAEFRQTTSPANLTSAWHVGGQGLRNGPSAPGEFVLNADENEPLVKAVLPAGTFTNAISDRLNGTLRSPTLPLGKKHISFEVIGQRSSAVRLVSNNCQLNYKNYKALTKPDWSWITFSPPDERDSLRTYAELMTMFDNPKFPDQLAALGGDSGNYRLPWEKAAENPRSYFGITHVVLHDVAEPPKRELAPLRRLWERSELDAAARYSASFVAALDRWISGTATDDDVHWLDTFLRRDLLTNQPSSSLRLNELVQQFRSLEQELSLPRVVAGVGDGDRGFDQPVFARGDCERPGERVPRRFLAAFAGSIPDADKPFAANGSGRLELARQMASPHNPLTARVFVNRVWHHLFGAGLVRTVDDFGHVGELPSHPELLDDLAARFVEEGWSTKWLVREIVRSRVFQLSSQTSALAKEVDPQNRWLSHFPARRLEAEAIRDAILASSGRLDLTLFGMSIQPYREKEYADRRLFPGPLDGAGRRSLYIKTNLMESPKFLGAFNVPGGKVTQGRRDVTNVPAQALALLNDPFVIQQAEVWATKLVTEPDSSVPSRIARMFNVTLHRSPSEDELARFEQVVNQLAELHQVAKADVLKSSLVWRDVAHTIFNLKEFIYIP